MKTSIHSLLLCSALLALATAVRAEPAAPAGLPEALRIATYVAPVFPVTLHNTALKDGYAHVQVVVAADGTLQESFVSAYSLPEFAAAAESALKRWTFRADTTPGALAQRFNVRFSFRRDGMVIVQGDMQEVVRSFLGQTGSEREVEVCKLRDLDATPEAVSMVTPAYPEALKKQAIEGAAAVSFFIDEAGRVRVPTVVGATHPEFAAAALAAAQQWVFSPPQHAGRSTRVFAVQQFNFAPGKAPTMRTVTQ